MAPQLRPTRSALAQLVSPSAIAKGIAWYEAGAGLGGLYVLSASGAYFVKGPPIGRLLITGVLTGYCVLLVVAGLFLLRHRPGGLLVSRLAQSLQIPQLITHLVTYSLMTPVSLVLSFNANFEIGLEFNIAADFRLLFGRHPEIAAVGVNLFPLVVLYLLRRHRTV